ncbi:MAG: PDZ domain-containing protein, partial [Oligoflexales bacterium]|nr:PDZ domain-containing protein [Oligoflexales bacterium]
MKNFSIAITLAALFLIGSGCGDQKSDFAVKARPLTFEEKLSDFDTATHYFEEYYAPLHYKEKRWKTDYESRFRELRKEILPEGTDADFYRVMSRLTASFRDAHVSIKIEGATQYTIPLTFDFIDGRYLLTYFSPFYGQSGISVGDELLEIDGVSTNEIVSELNKFHSTGHMPSDKRMLATLLTKRNYIMPPRSTRSILTMRQPDSEETYKLDVYWQVESDVPSKVRITGDSTVFPWKESIAGEMYGIDYTKKGASDPFFFNDDIAKKYSFKKDADII